MAERDSGGRRGLFRRAARERTPEQNPAAPPAARRERRSTGEMLRPRQPTVEDPWSSDAWADDGWNDEWDDPSRRVSIRPAAAPRSAAVDAWLESDHVEFADVTADIARKWAPDLGASRGATWDEPEPPVLPAPSQDQHGESTPDAELDWTSQSTPDIDADTVPQTTDETIAETVPGFAWTREPIHETAPEPAHETVPEPAHETVPEPAHETAPEPAHETARIVDAEHRAADPYRVDDAQLEPQIEERVEAQVEERVTKPTNSSATENIVEGRTADDLAEDLAEDDLADDLAADDLAEELTAEKHVPSRSSASQEFRRPGDAISWVQADSPPARSNLETAATAATGAVVANNGFANDASDPILGSGWDDEPIGWTDDPVVRALDDDFDDNVLEDIVVKEPETERRTVPRALRQGLVPAAYEDVDRSIDLDLAEELDNDQPTYVRRKTARIGKAASAPARAKKRDSQPTYPKRAPIGKAANETGAKTTPVTTTKRSEPAADVSGLDFEEEFWDDIDPNALATSRLDTQLTDEPVEAARDFAVASPDSSASATHAPRVVLEPVATQATLPPKKHPIPPISTPSLSTNAKPLVRLLLSSGLGLAGLAVLRLVIALIATVQASTEITSFGDRLVDTANNLGPEQGVLLILSTSLVILGRFAALGKGDSISRLTGRVCGIVLAAASATLLIAVAKLMNALGADDSNFASSAQAVVEFLALGGMSLVAMYGAWTSASE